MCHRGDARPRGQMRVVGRALTAWEVIPARVARCLVPLIEVSGAGEVQGLWEDAGNLQGD